MNKLNQNVPSVTHNSRIESDISVRWLNPEKSRRLIVLIPPGSDCVAASRRIWKLASETGSIVKLLGLCKNTTEELALRRELVTISAMIWDAKVFVESKIEIGNNWVDAVKHNYEGGDMLVCLAEQSIGIRRRPLSQILESTFRAPIYILSETKSQQPRSTVLSQVIAWSGFIAIMAGFFILQMKIVQFPGDWFQTVLSILLLIPEFGLILFWNSLFS